MFLLPFLCVNKLQPQQDDNNKNEYPPDAASPCVHDSRTVLLLSSYNPVPRPMLPLYLAKAKQIKACLGISNVASTESDLGNNEHCPGGSMRTKSGTKHRSESGSAPSGTHKSGRVFMLFPAFFGV